MQDHCSHRGSAHPCLVAPFGNRFTAQQGPKSAVGVPKTFIQQATDTTVLHLAGSLGRGRRMAVDHFEAWQARFWAFGDLPSTVRVLLGPALGSGPKTKTWQWAT